LQQRNWIYLKAGGEKSPLTDRRNWDGYIVDGAERRLSPNEAKMMQGFPYKF
jgi:DNA (cytosine-5)-methyltransferase 1